MKPSEFHPAAEIEFAEAKNFYNSRVPGLGDEFYHLVEDGIRKISEAPTRFSLYHLQTRRFRTRRFPYLIVYREKETVIQIIAIAHGSRQLGYWADRI